MRLFTILLVLVSILCANFTEAQKDKAYNLSEDKVLYLVGYAHLDSQWRWDYPTTINEYLKNTLDDNFELFEKYPEYVFNFTGSRRYKLMKEYYPDRYDKLKEYVEEGRWLVSGSSVDEGDVNAPSPESVIRQVLYGNQYFRKEFGKESVDYMLPDCFGFQAHMPSVWAHCGIKGFSTQKLKWGSAVGVPFNVGVWEGPDGESIVMANSLNAYVSGVQKRIDTSASLAQRLEKTGEKYGFFGGYSYYGVGDVGGAPKEKDVRKVMSAMDNPDSKIKVLPASSGQMYKDITAEMKKNLPKYKGDFLLTEHSAASITSQAYMKRWNRKNEKLAQAAEAAASMADWYGTSDYPFRKINDSWELVLDSQMHDILPGTSIPKANHYAWNDEVIAMNGFAEVEKNSVDAFSRAMDTQVEGEAVLVFNPVSKQRQDMVTATLKDKSYENVAVFDPSGKKARSQVLSTKNGNTKLAFIAEVPSAGYAVYSVKKADPSAKETELEITPWSLENAYYKVKLNESGDVASIYDKKLEKELLKSPIRLAFLKANPRMWPAWNMSWRERIHEPMGYVDGKPEIRIKEDGPARVALEVVRESRGSKFIQTLTLAAGEAGKRIDFDNKVVWKTKGATLKAVFPFTASNFNARYNLGLGTIERPSNHSRKYEVPSREWIDLTDENGEFGVSVLDDCKHGSDKPDENTIRLTLIHTPVANSYHDQATQDIGTHQFSFALYGHQGNWNQGNTEWQGLYHNQPLRAFSVPKHPGELGKTFSFAGLNTDNVAIRAIKKSEDKKGYIIRLQEHSGTNTKDVELSLAQGIASAHEVDGQERKITDMSVKDEKLSFNMTGYEIKSIAVQLKDSGNEKPQPESHHITLDFNKDVFSQNENRKDGALDNEGKTYPAEQFPDKFTSENIRFKTGSKKAGAMNALECRGQKIQIPEGDFNKIYFLASAKKETKGTFSAGKNRKEFTIQPWTGFVGQWDKRVFRTDEQRKVKRIIPGFIKKDNIAWYCTHHHTPDSNVAYRYSYLYKYALPVDEDAEFLRLPDNPDIMVFAVTAAQDENAVAKPLAPLYDELEDRKGFEMPEDRYFGKDLEPYATFEKTLKGRQPDKLFEQISDQDYANLTSLHGVEMLYYPKGEAYTKAEVQGEKILLQDNFDGSSKGLGSFDENIWYDNGEGRYVMDLKKPVKIDSINTFAPVFSQFGISVYTAWATNDPSPEIKGNPAENGWTFLGANRKGGIWGKAWNKTSIKMPEKAKPFRYIMWIADKNWHGTQYFFEVDVFEN
ncbi:MAG: alpha-mannosidase [Bacteroidales bacterium]|nr:alpha-mannosidase [Bacteroidales bacterium]